jgi:hypothetical protein
MEQMQQQMNGQSQAVNSLTNQLSQKVNGGHGADHQGMIEQLQDHII